MFPVEKIIDISQGRVSQQDRETLDLLALPFDRALELTARDRKTSCQLLDDMVTLNIEGNVMPCCGSSMEKSNVVGTFLEAPITELQERRRCTLHAWLSASRTTSRRHILFETIADGTIREYEARLGVDPCVDRP